MSRHSDNSLQHDAEHVEPDRRMPVYHYLTILFATAFLLLLLAYFMESRANQDHVETLTDHSASALQSVEFMSQRQLDLQEELTALNTQIDQLSDTVEEQATAIATLEEAVDTETQRVVALDWLSKIENLYQTKDTASLVAVIAEFEEQGLSQYLPTSSLHTSEEEDYLSPARRYWVIQESVEED